MYDCKLIIKISKNEVQHIKIYMGQLNIGGKGKEKRR